MTIRSWPPMTGPLLVALGLALGSGFAGGATPEEARKAEQDGRWEDAAEAWGELARTDAPARFHRLRLLWILGDLPRLEEESRRGLAETPGWVDGAIYLARARAARGDLSDAVDILRPFERNSSLAAVERADFLGQAGDHDAAAEIYRRVMAEYEAGTPSPRERLAAGHAARARGDFHGAARVYETAYQDSLDFLEARIALAELFNEKYQARLAADELAAASRIAPHHPDLHRTAAELAVHNTNLRGAEQAAEAVLEVRSEDPGARAVLARLALIADQPEVAREHLQAPLRTNPADLRARSLLAAARYLEGDSTAYRRELERIADQDPAYVEGHLVLGQILELSRRNEEAFALYRLVLDRDPENADALLNTGLLAMREGEEARAREFLESGFERDPFNIRAYNQLELLDKMDTFSSYASPNFELRLDAPEDSLLAPLLLERLESLYADLVEAHEWQPDRATIVEVFPNHSWFSARVTGLPWIGGIPAVCFGDVVAMDSPRTLSGGSNWNEILRHEFGHVLALGMTNKKVPFWFTEGLSVFLEEYPRGESWDANLRAAYEDGWLVPVDSLTIAFTRPRDQAQRLLAYHESYLLVRDLVARKGWEVVPRLLRAFGEGRPLPRAWKDEVGESFDRFREHAMKVIRKEAESLVVWPAPGQGRAARLRASDPEDVAGLSRRCLEEYRLPRHGEARTVVERLLEIDSRNARALGIFGLVLVGADQPDSARDFLSEAVRNGSRDVPVYLALAALEAERDNPARALALYEQAVELYPWSIQALHGRARILGKGDDVELTREAYRTLLSRSATAWQAAIELARVELAEGRGEEAAALVDYAVSTRPLDADLEALRGQAFLLLDRDQEAYRQFLFARSLDLRSVETMVGMSSYYMKKDDFEEAAYFAQLALKYAPEHPVARDLLLRAQAD